LSPLDPSATEIARYSSQILPQLAHELRVAAVEDGAGARDPDWWDAGQLKPEPAAGVAALPVYHIGNNPAHLPIFAQSQREPGLVVLHDLSLVDLARHISRERGEPDWWKRQMLRQYGEAVAGLVHRSENSAADYIDMTSNYPLFLPFVEDALGVVVHSDHARRALLDRLPAGAAVRRLDLPGSRSIAVPERDYTARPLSFVFCGHVGPNRRLLEFLEAWGTVEQRDAFRLHLYGNINNRAELQQYAERAGVAGLVSIHGYVPEDKLESALQSAHFAINLRWPTMGEASASQLRYWSAALPSLVTDVGWYAELPDDAVCKISTSTEIQDIAAVLRDALQRPREYQRRGRRGWEYLGGQHAPADYARQLAGFVEALVGRRLGCRAVEQDLVGVIAGMCEDSEDIKLFSPAITTAITTIGPGIYRDGEPD
jgi:glycosyltransferase involved in cell wall biosynthesis